MSVALYATNQFWHHYRQRQVFQRVPAAVVYNSPNRTMVSVGCEYQYDQSFIRYADGVCPVWFLKYLPKKDWFGKLSL